MMMTKETAIAGFMLGLLLLSRDPMICYGALQVGFYRGKCGFADVETIVGGVVSSHLFRDPSILASLVRLHFHDCFVNGCDASILLDGTDTEKMASPNHSVRGYEIIDQAKAAVDKICPGVVSCADLIAIAARDAVFLSGGGIYRVQTGRKDGLVSSADIANMTLPGPSITVPQAIAAFADKGLTAVDMVLLLGAHSVGVAHCSFLDERIHNFRGSGRPDPSMDQFTANTLRSRCPINSIENTVNLDQNPFSPFVLDNSYYQNILLRRGVLQIDQELGMNRFTRSIVANLAGAIDFPARFGAAMVRLGAVGVLTGTQGEIRRSCRVVNKVVSKDDKKVVKEDESG
ncbi:Peroxidase 60 [Linum grandiflorum]